MSRPRSHSARPSRYSSHIDQRAARETEAFLSDLEKAMYHGQEAFDDESEASFFDIVWAGLRLTARGKSFIGIPLLQQVANSRTKAFNSTNLGQGECLGLYQHGSIHRQPRQARRRCRSRTPGRHASSSAAPRGRRNFRCPCPSDQGHRASRRASCAERHP